uniref:Dynein heavy chain 10, axonemal n=1 Tax=Cacopsylla melanoneura TaxID=428564 RepID=A0A8D8QN62_9HEMI
MKTSLSDLMKRPCLVVGDTGTSKTATMMDFLRSLSPDTYSQLHVNFSALTSSMSMQRNLELVVEKKTRDVYGPPAGKKLVLFIDDLNLPQVDMYGTQQPIAFLKLLFEKDGLYGRDKNLSWKNIQETVGHHSSSSHP